MSTCTVSSPPKLPSGCRCVDREAGHVTGYRTESDRTSATEERHVDEKVALVRQQTAVIRSEREQWSRIDERRVDKIQTTGEKRVANDNRLLQVLSSMRISTQ